MEQALSARWGWWVLPHTCVAFCEEVISAGGGHWVSYSNCPAIATEVPQHAIGQFIRALDADISHLYGVSR